MTTTAHAIPALEVSAPDDNMDVLSDTGFDLGDGDIDLDLETAPSVYDDDMSLNDAATDGGLEVQDLPADQDDFMADQGDLIEEDDDDIYNKDDATAAPSQTVDNDAITFEADMLAPPDEDLIDYSDDEAQQPVKMRSPSMHEEEDAQVFYEGETISATADITQEEVHIEEEEQPVSPTEASGDGAQAHQNDPVESHVQRETSPSISLEHQTKSEVEPYFDSDNDEGHVHVDDGGVLLPVEENPQHNDDTALEQQEEAQQNVVEVDGSDHHTDHQIELRPVTVNYDGNELWLFKQHDLDKSGDYLLDDLSVAKSSMSDLFQACRSSLGDDVTGEQEIGFRLDHLHNLELYEDNTACVAVSLERLVDLYYTLQAQDDNPDPECFYITLQFRPRFATLLADVARYAEQGSGYSALYAAVEAGETHFSNIISSASTEHDYVEWDDEENDEEEASSPGSVHSPALQNAGNGEPDEQQFEDVEEHEEGQEAKSNQDYTEPQYGVDLKRDIDQTLDTQDEESHSTQEGANVDTSENAVARLSTQQTARAEEPEPEAVAGAQASESRDERTPDQIAHDNQEAEDFVDYSDDEDDCEVKSVQAHEPSPSSSTVQGDEPTETQEPGIVSELDRQDENAVEAGFDEHEDDTTLLTQTQYGDDVNHYAFQDYEETYNQDDPFPDFQADGTVGDAFETNNNFDGDINQDFTDNNFQTLEGEANLDFNEQPLDEGDDGDHFDETLAAAEDATDTGALLDLDNAPEWAIDTDPASNLPGEDAVLLHDDAITQEDYEGGAIDQSAAIISSDAELALASSNDHKPSSPQGQKRSIDEVDSGINDAPDSTDAKRPRV